MNANFGWTSPIMGQDAQVLYRKLYGDNGEGFIPILDDCPPEVAVLSRLAAYLKDRQGRR